MGNRWILAKLLVVVMWMTMCCTSLFGQRNAGFRINRNWDLALTQEQCKEIVSAGLAVVDQESSKLRGYIDMESAPQIIRQTFEIEEENKKNMRSGNFFYGVDSGTSYFRIIFFPKEEHAYRFEEGYAVMVYLHEDCTPLGLKMGYRTNTEIVRLRADKPLKRKEKLEMPKVVEVPMGFPDMTDDAREQLARKSVDVVKAQVEGHYSIVSHEYVAIVMRVLMCKEGEESRQAYKTVLRTTGAFVYVYLWEDTGEVFGINFDSTNVW